MRLLLVEDDLRTAQFVANGLREAGFLVEHFSDGRQAMQRGLVEPFDVAVVDIMLPSMNGLALIREWRGHRVMAPILVLSARGSIDDRVKGLQTGGDDYLVKPFAFAELLARIQALLRRSAGVAEPTTFTVGDLTLDVVRRRVTRGNTEIDLQPREFALLEFLLRHAGRVVSRTMIMEHVWEYNFDPQTNVVEARVCHLRDKIDRPFDRPLIHTIRGVGYVIQDKR